MVRLASVFRVVSVLVGALVVLAAALAMFAFTEDRFGTPVAVAATVSNALLAPLLFTRWFVRAYRKLDPAARYLENLPGVAVLLALLTLAGFGFLGRAPLAHALESLGPRHPTLPGWVRGALSRVGHALRPEAPRPNTPTPVARRPAPTLDAGVRRDAALVVDTTTTVDARADATVAADVTGTTDTTEVTDTADAATTNEVTVGNLCPNGGTLHRLRDDAVRDALVVVCETRAAVAVVTDEGSVREAALVSARVPEPMFSSLSALVVADLDRDQRDDLVACTMVLSERGGTRDGGGLFWLRNLGLHRFAPPVRIARVACSDLAVTHAADGSVDALVVADWGNEYLASHPEGELRWYRGRGARWAQSGHVITRVEPEVMWMGDANGDGLPDVMIEHMSRGSGAVVFPARGRGWGEIDTTLHPAPEPDRGHASGLRLDPPSEEGDATLGSGTLRLRRQSPFARTQQGLSILDDHQSFEITP